MRAPARDDAGLTLTETLVAMVLTTVALAAFASGLRLMTTTVGRVTSITAGMTSLRQAQDLLGRQLGAASTANTPVLVGSSWYLEFSTDAVRAGLEPQCTQWRYQQATGLLQYRTWGTATLAPTGWLPAGSLVVNDARTQPPFTVYAPDAGFNRTRVLVDLRVRATGGPVVQNQGQYVLRNSTDALPPGADVVCSQLGRP